MSYNIRFGEANDGDNSWEFRRPATLEMLKEHAPDVFGVQEALDYQLKYITDNNRKYTYVGVGRDEGNSKGEHSAIVYNKRTIKLYKQGTFWLSETPDVPSKGWDARHKRIATWALLKDKKTGNKFYFVNTHLDHKGRQAQKNSLLFIVEFIRSINPDGFPMVLTGDFNVRPDNPALAGLNEIMSSTRTIARSTDNNKTYNGWGKVSDNPIIDYIYIDGFTECLEYETVTDSYLDIPYTSDHYAIKSTLIF